VAGAAAAVGFIAVACFDTLLDAPRITLLLTLVGAATMIRASSLEQRRGATTAR
jgi:hypothetical protein